MPYSHGISAILYVQVLGVAYHAQTHSLVRVDEVGEDLGGGGDGDTALVPELVEAALHSEVGKPILAILSINMTG